MRKWNGATLLITGGTGSFGSTVLKHFLASDIGEIRIFSRDEKKQDWMRHSLQANYPEYAGKVKVGKVNVDDEMELAQQFGIMNIPTMILFKNGEKVNQIVGAVPKENILAML